MSAVFEVPVAGVVAVATLESATEMESAWRQAWEARGQAAEMGDYVAAERWHDRARELASRLDASKQDVVIASR